MQLHIMREAESRWIFVPLTESESAITFYTELGYIVETE